MPTSNVLIVDGDATTRSSLIRVLDLAGYRVAAFVDAESLLSKIRPGDRGCVMTELQLPGMDGLALQNALDERKVALPVIFISGRIDIPAVVTAMKRGAIDFLMKPVTPRALLAAVEAALRKSAEMAAARAAVEQAEARWASLSAREKDACKLAGRGPRSSASTRSSSSFACSTGSPKSRELSAGRGGGRRVGGVASLRFLRRISRSDTPTNVSEASI